MEQAAGTRTPLPRLNLPLFFSNRRGDGSNLRLRAGPRSSLSSSPSLGHGAHGHPRRLLPAPAGSAAAAIAVSELSRCCLGATWSCGRQRQPPPRPPVSGVAHARGHVPLAWLRGRAGRAGTAVRAREGGDRGRRGREPGPVRGEAGPGGGMSAAGGVGSCGPGGAACGGGVGGAASAPGGGVSMFRWLEVLEKEFDKAFVDVDLLLGEIDPDQADITYEGRQKMTSLSSCFAQLCHKAQTVSQINHKLEVRARRRGAEGPAGLGLPAPGRVRPAVGGSRTARHSGPELLYGGCPTGAWPGPADPRLWVVLLRSCLWGQKVVFGDERSVLSSRCHWLALYLHYVSRKLGDPCKMGQRHQESSSLQAAVRMLFLSTSE